MTFFVGVQRGTSKNRLDFGGDPDHITSGLCLQLPWRRFELYWLLFLPRDAMCKRSLCCRPVSILVHCIHMAEDIVKLLYRLGSPIIHSSFWPPAPVPNSNGNPFSGGAKYTGWENFAIFDWNRRLSRKRYEIGNRPMVAMELFGTLTGSHMRSIEWWNFQSPWRTPNPVFKVTAFLKSNVPSGISLRDKVTIEH